MKARRSMDRWLGDGGMALLGELGATLESYGVDGEDLGWCEGTFVPTALAANPHGGVQAGVHTVLMDAAMNFALNAALDPSSFSEATIEISTELLRGAVVGGQYRLRGEVVRLSRQIAHCEASLTDHEGATVSHGAATFLLRRASSD